MLFGLNNELLLYKLLFTFVILIIFRLGVHIPIPGVDAHTLASFTNQQNIGLIKIFNTFSGGALTHFSLFSLATMPYISSSIIVQLMTVVFPALEQMQKEGTVGRQKLNRITRFLTVILSLIQGYMLAAGLESAKIVTNIVIEPGASFRLLSMLLMCAGSCFVMWLGEQITEKGVGNGISFLIFSGIVAYFPYHFFEILSGTTQSASYFPKLLFIVCLATIFVFFVSFIEMSYRKIPIQYARRVSTEVKYSLISQASHLPLKVNMSGVMAAIFSSTALAIPITMLSYKMSGANIFLNEILPEHWLYNLFFCIFGFCFTYFYTSIVFKPDEIAENLKKQSAFIPGLRPGHKTSDALNAVAKRLCLFGGVYLNLIVILPGLFSNISSSHLNLGGTSLLIVVGVALETIRQVNSHISSQQYDKLFFKSDYITSSTILK